ncbi:MAG: penicillin-binding transpeptidase domain-containing protein [Chloroflexi bacterium]|nr:penicillin-binding transpeptidase domain-containing protein [Chloroflexota bacterium]
MKTIRILILLTFLLSACNQGGRTTSTSPDDPSSGALPTPVVETTFVPEVSNTVQEFLKKWNEKNYSGMYSMLSKTSRDATTEDVFIKLYQDTMANLTIKKIVGSITSTLINPLSAKVGYQVNFETIFFSTIQRTMEMNLVIESGLWKIQWGEEMILPELAGGNRLMLNIQNPIRGDINDRNGNTLVTQTAAVALGVIPSYVSELYDSNLSQILEGLMGIPKNIIKEKYRSSSDWYVPIGEVSQAGYDEVANALNQFGGLVVNPYTSRYYFNQGISSQVLGYLLSISPEMYEEYRRNGYAGDEKVGVSGLEKWGESYLRGSPGADLYVVKPDGTYSTRLASTDPQAPNVIYTTLDKDFQLLVQKALLGFTGAIVVMEVDSGKILAMTSSPSFDPNVFQTDNYNSQYVLSNLVNDPETPLWNRATQSAYPLGSVFKLVTAAAALESGLYQPTTTYECTSQFTELPGFTGDDWTYTKELPPSGTLTLLEGIMRSCNPWFYHLGLDLFRQKGNTYLSDMARGFGLGEATGIDAVAEDSGQIIDPVTEGDAVQMGIGQGNMLITPLQVVDFIAAIANGGTLYRPQIIDKITSIDGEEIQSFTPQIRRQLPLSQETLDALKEGMRMVIEEEKGTAHAVFAGMKTPIYGKTGTATTSIIDPHSWFAGFTDANRTDKPDIAIVVIAENAGDGSKYAAPIFKRVVEAYFLEEIISLYSWEKNFYLTKTPVETSAP